MYLKRKYMLRKEKVLHESGLDLLYVQNAYADTTMFYLIVVKEIQNLILLTIDIHIC